MPNEGRTDEHWRALCYKLAAGLPKPTGQGWMPGANNPWKGRIQNILACGVTKRKQSKSSILPFGGGSAACTCGWDHEKYDRDNQPTPAAPAAAAAAPPRPQKKIEFGILRKPSPRKHLSDIRGRHHVYAAEDGCYPLEVFGFTNGKCPHCKSSNIDAGNRNNSVKTIYTRSGKPRFVQGMGLKCNDCGGKGWQSYEKTYVDTLTKNQQDKLHAIIAGKRSGVDMDIIRTTTRR